MESKAVTTVLSGCVLLVIFVSAGSSLEASSYSNQFHGYQYTQRVSSFIDEKAIERLFQRLRSDHIKRYPILDFNAKIFPEHQDEQEFSYNDFDQYGPSNWDKVTSVCGGVRQSPINLNSSNVAVKEDASPLVINGLDIVPTAIDVENNGHSLKLVLKYSGDDKVTLTGGPLKSDVFILDNIHFHWGNNIYGSEHTVNGRQYAAEMHLVTFNSTYGTLQKAVKEVTGLAVLGIFLDFDRTFRAKDNQWTKFASKVSKAHSTYTEINYLFPLLDIVKSRVFKEIASYPGSLTTPGCSENVLWMLSTKPIPIKQNELYELRKLRDLKGRRLLKNFRPVQELNGRKVTLYRS